MFVGRSVLTMFLLLSLPRMISIGDACAREGPLKRQCTSFVLDNNGYAVFGTNYDYGKDVSEGLVFVNKRNITKSYWQSDSLFPHARWTSRFGSVSFNLCMSQLSWAGMNEAGLVISTMQLDGSQSPEPDKRPWIFSNYWVQYVLDNFSTVEEVIASDSSIRIVDYVDHYLVSDRFGHCATIEFLKGQMIVHTGRDLPAKVLSNNTYEGSVAEWKKTLKQKKRGESLSLQASSVRRFIRAANRVSAFVSTTSREAVDTAFDILEEISGQNTHGSPTRWRIVFDTKNFCIYFKTIVHAVMREIRFQKVDFSCESPVRMVNINERLAGDITDQLEEYSSMRHFDHALHAWKKWGVEIDSSELQRQIRFIEHFPSANAARRE